MTPSKRRKIEWYLTHPHLSTEAVKKIIRELLDEIKVLEERYEDAAGKKL